MYAITNRTVITDEFTTTGILDDLRLACYEDLAQLA